MKKVAVGIVLALGFVSLQTAQAEVKPSIAIIDTAIDLTAPQLQGKIIYEVCVMEEMRCPNGKAFQEGPGSATISAPQIYSNGWDHGTIMASVAAQANSNINIVFIRVVPMVVKTGKQSTYSQFAIIDALEWVAKNKDKFNIVATSASMGHHKLKTGANYCPVHTSLRDSIVKLQGINVATMFATGNNYDYSRVDYPACIAEAIAVGATDKSNRISLYGNSGLEVDFFALGNYTVNNKNVLGTSASTVAFASYWAKSYAGSYQSTLDLLRSKAKPTENEKVKTTAFIDILG
jgi:hypothetical protein